MTPKEAVRITEQERALLNLGFTRDEAEALRRISMTLHRWYELECGTDHACIVRGTWNHETQTFDYDDNGRAYMEYAGGSGRHRYIPTRDRETGAIRRLGAIIEARNTRCYKNGHSYLDPHDPRAGFLVSSYLQTDPRGAVLYILRPGDVPEGKSAESYYNRGVCVY